MHFGPWAYVCASTHYTKKGPEILMRRCQKFCLGTGSIYEERDSLFFSLTV